MSILFPSHARFFFTLDHLLSSQSLPSIHTSQITISNERHLVHSHAEEGNIPGTVDLCVVEGDGTAYGQARFPVLAEDPNDHLQCVKEIATH
ncbi:mfs transporter [Ophiostoma piceae UAMH 11346]|uniref:Mfs transporter n=1 Tax=Ophiostoma piceae (strain UAMH 11346) TaxID=1262450 RepID=S3BW12_OPHP1|nr:mfs transporter [Ophiostoma piceae UAMH 11346]